MADEYCGGCGRTMSHNRCPQCGGPIRRWIRRWQFVPATLLVAFAAIAVLMAPIGFIERQKRSRNGFTVSVTVNDREVFRGPSWQVRTSSLGPTTEVEIVEPEFLDLYRTIDRFVSSNVNIERVKEKPE